VLSGNNWLGTNGKYYNKSWGGNQFTGSRSGAFKASGAYKLAGRATFVIGAAFSIYDGIGQLSEGNDSLSLYYGPDDFRARSVLEKKDANGVFQIEKTNYYAAGYEETHAVDGSIQKRHYITTPKGLTAIYVEDENGNGALHYIHQNYQGSIMAVTAEDGTLEQHLSGVYPAFCGNPWGRRRNPTSWNSYDLTGHEPMFDRGYTGHSLPRFFFGEQLEEFGLINMNGRMS
jgi:hypothetical protein